MYVETRLSDWVLCALYILCWFFWGVWLSIPVQLIYWKKVIPRMNNSMFSVLLMLLTQ